MPSKSADLALGHFRIILAEVLRRSVSVFVVVSALVGCGNPTVIIWTDTAEAAPVVELFNAEQDRYVVELVYEPDVSRALRVSQRSADVVVAGSIEDASTARLFRPLDRLLRGAIESDEFYAPLLANGSRSGRQLLLPVSFNLPLVYFSQRSIVTEGGISLSPGQMRTAGLGFNEIDGANADQIAFSPLWDGSFLYQMIRFNGLAVRESPTGEPEWSMDALLVGLNVALEWILEDNGGVEIDRAFREHYLYDPIIRLVQKGRILFGFDSSDSFLRRSDEARKGLHFRWLGSDENIPVLESIVYAGIPDRAANRAGAEAFITWLFDPEVQRELLANNRRKRIDSFGMVGGFSSLRRVTERAIPDQYPRLQSFIPPAEWLRFPPPSPRHWNSVAEAVVQPWLLGEAAGLRQSRDLATSVSAWMLQQEE